MDLSENLKSAFSQFLAHEISDDLLRTIKESVTVDDVGTLINSVESLGDPSEYCKDDLDEKTPAGFFLYIDFIGALIIDLGDSAIERVVEFEKSEHAFVRWVLRYVSDERFHQEISSKFEGIFAG